MRQPRRHFSADEKVKILCRRLIEHESVSDICNELNLQPTVFYTRRKQFFENGAAAFEKTRINAADFDKRRIAELEAKSRRKNEVVAELMVRPYTPLDDSGSSKPTFQQCSLPISTS